MTIFALLLISIRSMFPACPMFQVAAARGGYGGERYEKLEFQKKVEQKFKSLRDTAWQVLCLIS